MLLALATRIQGLFVGFRGRFENEDGAVATEYALLLTLIALAIVGAATALGFAIRDKFVAACNSLGGTTCP